MQGRNCSSKNKLNLQPKKIVPCVVPKGMSNVRDVLALLLPCLDNPPGPEESEDSFPHGSDSGTTGGNSALCSNDTQVKNNITQKDLHKMTFVTLFFRWTFLTTSTVPPNESWPMQRPQTSRLHQPRSLWPERLPSITVHKLPLTMRTCPKWLHKLVRVVSRLLPNRDVRFFRRVD